MSKLIPLFASLAFFCVSASAETTSPANPLEIVGMDKLAANLKLDLLKKEKFSSRVKIAVFDNGFWGYERDLGKMLPAETLCFSNSEVPDQQCKDEYKIEEAKAAEAGVELKDENKPFHGLLTAEIITQILSRAGDSNYEITMFRTNGLDRLTRAIKKVVAENYDIVVYADVWEFGGFGDGKGFVNAAINEALDKGIVWINSAGNFGRSTRLAPVATGADGWVTFKDAKGKLSDGVTIRCSLTTSCNARLVLAWNDFKDDPEVGTDKQLNLYLFDEQKVQVAQSEKIQALNPPENDKRYSKLPRQMILFDLTPDSAKKSSKYTLRVKNMSKNFNAASDKLRITVSGLGVEMLDPSLGETILPPADNPKLIAIGASDDPGASSSRALKLPKIYLKSVIELKNGLRLFESSTAAAMAGAMAALYVGSGTERTRDAVEKKLLTISRASEFPLPAAGAEAPSVGRGEKVAPLVNEDGTAARSPAPRVSAQPIARAQGRRFALPARYSGPYCLPQAAGSVNDPWLREQLENVLAGGGAAMVMVNGRLTIAVYFDIGRQYGNYRATPYDQYFLTAKGMMRLTPDQMYLLQGLEFIPLIETTAPLCP